MQSRSSAPRTSPKLCTAAWKKDWCGTWQGAFVRTFSDDPMARTILTRKVESPSVLSYRVKGS